MSIHRQENAHFRTAHEYSKDLYVEDITKQGLCWVCYQREGKQTQSINKSVGLCRKHYSKQGDGYEESNEVVVKKKSKLKTRKCIDCPATWEVIGGRGNNNHSRKRCLKCSDIHKRIRQREYSRRYKKLT